MATTIFVRNAGNAGNIEISVTESLSLNQNSALQAISVSQGNAGKITINAKEATVSLDNSSGISTSIVAQLGFIGTGQGGDINITAASLTLSNNSQIFTSTEGVIDIETNTLSLTNGAEINASTPGQGDNGLIIIKAQDIIIDERGGNVPGGLSSGVGVPRAIGNGGNIEIVTNTLSLIGDANISTITSGQGDGGSIIIKAQDITINREETGSFFNGISISYGVDFSGVGNSGDIEIETNTLSLTNGAEINSVTLGQGNAGNININATEEISISGTFFDNARNRKVGGILAFTETTGTAGNITIKTPILTLENGSTISAGTLDEGDAGLIQIFASDGIILAGESSLGNVSSIESEVGLFSTGSSQGISIDTSTLTLQNGARISTTTLGDGNGGLININASDGIILTGESSVGEVSRIESETFFGLVSSEGITIDTSSLTLENGAKITTNTGGAIQGGLIRITTTDIAFLNES